MPTYIVRPDRDQDFYVEWSTVVDSPVGWGTRAEMKAKYDEERLERADRTGTSANWPDWPVERMPFRYDDEDFMAMECAPWSQDDDEDGWWVLPRSNMAEYCRREDAGEPTADLFRFERDEAEADAVRH